jgi:hypothetical protein
MRHKKREKKRQPGQVSTGFTKKAVGLKIGPVRNRRGTYP